MAERGPGVGAGAPPQGGSSKRWVPVYERIKQAIIEGELAPGQQLVEVPLAEWCEVSRTPVREALKRLEYDGLAVQGNRGLVVRERSPEEILDIYETRIAMEATAARLAAERRTSHDLVRLRQLDTRMRQTGPGEPDLAAAANSQFHRAVWRASHNESLIDLLERLNMHLGRYPATTLAYPGRWETAGDEHRQLIEAIGQRDGGLAGKIASGHFTSARDIRLKLWESEAL